MSRSFKGWPAVAERLLAEAERHRVAEAQGERRWSLNEGQIRALCKLARHLPNNGMVLADEVGMGKTRISAALAKAVVESGGRVAVLIPRGLGYQWRDELNDAGVQSRPVVGSLWQVLQAFGNGECPEFHWFRQSVVLISHRITNWRLESSPAGWRWQLVPALYARWREVTCGRWPNGGRSFETHEYVSGAAEAVVEAAGADRSGPVAKLLDTLLEEVAWPDTCDPRGYGQSRPLRTWLERSVGMSLGAFDLVVIDEAHKSRGQESSLSRLLTSVVVTRRIAKPERTARRLAMTATPVELNADDWHGTLERICVDPAPLKPAIEGYARAVKAVRACPTDTAEVQNFESAAGAFKAALDPYLMRRDKREVPAVRDFVQGTGTAVNAYRDERDIKVRPGDLDVAWREAICAAEAISQLKSHQCSRSLQRLRLTLGNGHGILSVLDESLTTEHDDAQLKFEERRNRAEVSGKVSQGQAEEGAGERLAWWQGVLRSAVQRAMQGSLYRHPGVMAAVEAIEEADERGEKVLVFGRFTAPMKALTELLNARRMLLDLSAGKPWPQAGVPESAWPAVRVAHAQLKLSGTPEELVGKLPGQYNKLEAGRERIRTHLLSWLREGLEGIEKSTRARRVLAALGTDVVAPLARALTEGVGNRVENAGPQDWAREFVDLLETMADRDAMDDEEDDLDDERRGDLASEFSERLRDEYSGAKGAFARRMDGGTELPTRRVLQAAFNRPDGFPRVLVAQSMVGREGLNLHKACRTVVLLHPEWNPGVVEQQIGRVDRVGSRWETELASARARGVQPNKWPKIEIRPVIVEGTYDEHNWRVLRERWDELRSQLHGVVIPPRDLGTDPAMEKLAEDINAMSPNFSPEVDEALSGDNAATGGGHQ